MDSIKMFGVAKLFVMSNVQASIVNANILLPMSFCLMEDDRETLKLVNITSDSYLNGISFSFLTDTNSIITEGSPFSSILLPLAADVVLPDGR